MNRILTAVLVTVGALESASCTGAESNTQEKLQLSLIGFDLRLEARDGQCHVVSTPKAGAATQSPLGIPWPCHFHVDQARAVRTIADGGYIYALVESSKTLAPSSQDCDTQLRSIRTRGTKIEVSQDTDRVAACPPFQWDQIMFKELFR